MSIESIQADLDTHHITGYVGNGYYVHCPLISMVSGNNLLYMGGCIDGVRLPDDFDTVISLYPWEQYELGPNTIRHEYRMHDSNAVPPWEELKGPVLTAMTSLSAGKKTLIHCQAGLNRSGLITALVMTANPLGTRTMAENIAVLRERRHSLVLCNTAFENYLLKNF